MSPSHRRILRLGAAAVLVAARFVAAQQYSLDVSYDASNFFTSFDFFAGTDPTHGYVQYVDQATAQQAGLIGQGRANGSFFMGVDHTTVNPPNGRQSVRLTSKQAFTHGLFIADISHMPGSACGVWPAFWMFGPNWPSSGEIDIIEGVNCQASNAITLHTSPGFSISNQGTISSTTVKSHDCGNNANGGCGQQLASSQTYGDGFNAINGGVYATEWTSDHIAVWFFPRSSIPADIKSGQPSPSTWGQPSARFAGEQGCDIDKHFSNNQIVFDTTFCGDWAGNPSVWSSDQHCSSLAASCNDYVAHNPSAYSQAYWEVNSVKVYQQSAGGNSTANPGYQQPNATTTSAYQQTPVPTSTYLEPSVPSSTYAAPVVTEPAYQSPVAMEPAYHQQPAYLQPAVRGYKLHKRAASVRVRSWRG